MSELISAEISANNLKEALDAISTVKNALPFLVNLTNQQRQILPKMDDIRRPFVEKALAYAKSEPKVCPPYVDLDEFEKDLDLYKNLSTIFQEINKLNEMIDDTRLASSVDAYTAALAIYNSAKMAAKTNVPGVDTIVDDLKSLFESQGATDASGEQTI